MRKLIKTITLTAAFTVQGIFSGCDYRPLEDVNPAAAIIPVRIDWSASGVPVAGMHRASVLLFPAAGGAPLEYLLETNLYYRTIEVPVGVYSVVVMNETINESDWNSVSFTGTDNYTNFAAVGRVDASRGMYAYSTELPLILNPEPLAAWSLDRFEVTWDMAALTHNTYDIESVVSDLTVVKPLPRIERMTITARVGNLSSSMQSTGTINGMSSGVYMVSGAKITTPAAHAFLLNGRVYDPDGKDGTTTRTFNIFGKLPAATETHYRMNLDFVLNDGTAHPTEAFDVTNMIAYDANAIPPLNRIEVGYSIAHPDRPLVLPEMSVGSGIAVDDWDDVIIPL